MNLNELSGKLMTVTGGGLGAIHTVGKGINLIPDLTTVNLSGLLTISTNAIVGCCIGFLGNKILNGLWSLSVRGWNSLTNKCFKK